MGSRCCGKETSRLAGSLHGNRDGPGQRVTLRADLNLMNHFRINREKDNVTQGGGGLSRNFNHGCNQHAGLCNLQTYSMDRKERQSLLTVSAGLKAPLLPSYRMSRQM